MRKSDADAEQDERREAERVRGEDAEREVDRRRDLAVGDRVERARVELALAAREACAPLVGPPPEQPEPAHAGGR